MYIIRRVNEEQERFRLIDEIICKIKNKVNLLLFDGELLYVHTNYRDSLYQCQKGAAVVVSTRPLTKEIWEPEPMNRLAAYHNGNLFCTVAFVPSVAGLIIAGEVIKDLTKK